MPGKVDWLARGLPTEGDNDGPRRVFTVARNDVVSCSLNDSIAGLAERIDASPYGFALVTGDGGTLYGRIRRSGLDDARPDAPASEVMTPGPSTVRADLPVDELRERLDDRGLKTAIVTSPEGRLIGVVTRSALG